MNTKKLVLLATLISIIPTFHCGAMDTSTDVIPLNNGLLTEIPGIVSRTEYVGWFGDRYITSTRLRNDTLVNLLGYEKNLDPSVKGAGPIELFCPIIFKENNGYVHNLGQLNEKTHREAIEAIRRDRALYCMTGQGAFIYALDKQPKSDMREHIKHVLEEMLQNKTAIEIPH